MSESKASEQEGASGALARGSAEASGDEHGNLVEFPNDPQMLWLDGCVAVAAYAAPTTAASGLASAKLAVLIDPVLTVASLHKERAVAAAKSKAGGSAEPDRGTTERVSHRGGMVIGFPLVRAESAEHLLVQGRPAGGYGATQDEAKIGSAWQ